MTAFIRKMLTRSQGFIKHLFRNHSENRCSVRCFPLVESVTCLLSIETRRVDASSGSPIDTIYVFSPVVD